MSIFRRVSNPEYGSRVLEIQAVNGISSQNRGSDTPQPDNLPREL